MKNNFFKNRLIISIAIFLILIVILAVVSLSLGEQTPNPVNNNDNKTQPIDAIGSPKVVPILDKTILYPVVVGDQQLIRFISGLKPEFQDYNISTKKIVKQYHSEELYFAPKQMLWSPDYSKVIINEGFVDGKPLPISLFNFKTSKYSIINQAYLTANWSDNNKLYMQIKTDNIQSALYEISSDGKQKNKIVELDLTDGIVTAYPIGLDNKLLLFYLLNPSSGQGKLKTLDLKSKKIDELNNDSLGYPFMSQSRKKVAIRNQNTNDIMVIDLQTGESQNVGVKSPREIVAWSNDDKHLYIASPNAQSGISQEEGDSLYRYEIENKSNQLIINNIDNNKLGIDSILPVNNQSVYITASDSLFKIQLD